MEMSNAARAVLVQAVRIFAQGQHRKLDHAMLLAGLELLGTALAGEEPNPIWWATYKREAKKQDSVKAHYERGYADGSYDTEVKILKCLGREDNS